MFILLILEFRRVQELKYGSVARYFPSMYKALGSIPCTGKKKKKKKKKVRACKTIHY